MNMMIPDKRALCVSENASQSLHNLTALRGSLVRDSQAWSRYLDETIVLFGQETDVCFGGHNWPVWGTDAVLRFLSEQRDLYAYLHDQTILKMSQGLTGIEIAEELHLPVGLDTAWHAQSFYGSLNQNVKSIYQRYMGWYDGNPAHLWEHPPVAASQRYVSCMGGAEDVLRKAAEYEKDQDFRFAATLLNHLVFAQPTHDEAKTRLADLYERLAWSQMCAPWRDSYLVAALELRTGPPQPGGAPATDGVLAAANIEQILSSLAVRIDGSRAQYMSVDLELQITDGHVNERLFRVFISHGALIQRKLPCSHSAASPRCLLTKRQLLHLVLTGNVAEDMQEQGDEAMVQLQQLAGLIQLPRSNFNIVTP
jgi:alkyl sulfatase BDS1-like metallo-beta-lactamase superfamily hydrolase